MDTIETKELRVFSCPKILHDKIETYMAIVRVNEGRVLTKDTASVELLDKATKDIVLKGAAA